MKILLTTHQFFPEFSAGTEVLTRSVALELMKRGHEVRVLTGFPSTQVLTDESRVDAYEFEGIHVYRFHHAYAPMGGQTSMVELTHINHLASKYFANILQIFKPALVHFFHLNRLGVGLIDEAVQAGVPVFMTPTDFWAICPTGQLMLPDGKACGGPSPHAGNCTQHFAENSKHTSKTQNRGGRLASVITLLPTVVIDQVARLTRVGALPLYPRSAEVKAMAARLPGNVARLNQLHKIVTPNRWMTDLLLRHGVMPRRIVQAAYGIDIPKTLPATERPPLRKPLRIGFVGTLVPHKGCHVLVDAVLALPAGVASLKIYGNPDEFVDYTLAMREKLAAHQRLDVPETATVQAAKAQVVSAVEFCGVFSNANIGAVLQELDVLVVPSLWPENTPLVLYSAQAARCPVIGSDFPGISEVVQHEHNGLLFEPGDAKALSAQLIRLVNEPGLAERLSANTQAPQSTAGYVDELLVIWGVDA